jgi:hypothetical protein
MVLRWNERPFALQGGKNLCNYSIFSLHYRTVRDSQQALDALLRWQNRKAWRGSSSGYEPSPQARSRATNLPESGAEKQLIAAGRLGIR